MTLWKVPGIGPCNTNTYKITPMKIRFHLIVLLVLFGPSLSYAQQPTAVDSSLYLHLDTLVEAWHYQAAVADEAYFDKILDGGVFIGTDATERWTKAEFEAWCTDIFKRESAWVFTTKSRHIQWNARKDVAWFDELLDTWMGVCRGSGVLVLEAGTWRIAHYHLSITVPNERVKAFLALMQAEEDKEKQND